ncbi:hypothetical protein Tco_1205577 [Tanacetum coccineum]
MGAYCFPLNENHNGSHYIQTLRLIGYNSSRINAHLIKRDALSTINDMVVAGFEPTKEYLKKVRRLCLPEMAMLDVEHWSSDNGSKLEDEEEEEGPDKEQPEGRWFLITLLNFDDNQDV